MDDAVTELDAAACWALLNAGSMGRLAVAPAGEVDIFPINYVASEGLLYFRTAPGSKLLDLTVNPSVAFEIDGHDDATAFSVVVKGTADQLESQAEIDVVEKLPLTPWIPTLKYRWVRIRPATVTGRSFRRDPEPDRF
ncbi:MAG: pyridoxamine 5'-phosphate oxidase family protein [Rhodoglobus sp.]